MVCPLVIKKIWQFKSKDFFELVNIVKELREKVERLEALTERQGNQIENAFNIFQEREGITNGCE